MRREVRFAIKCQYEASLASSGDLSQLPHILFHNLALMLGLRTVCRYKQLTLQQHLRQLHAPNTVKAASREQILSASAAKTSPSELPAPKKWTANSIRTGLIARKRGMTSLWNDQGVRIPVTVLQVSWHLL
jgi:hypothetical protein